ncbi:MAG: hypothetical protein LIP28_03375 [Deltaproteobacteria bacterium]|nr:hypothetical protein [Deltaproteobacteria bacterium]
MREDEFTAPLVARPVEVLVGAREMAAFLKISKDRVRGLERLGAPVIRDSSGIMRAEKYELWRWWFKHMAAR